MMLRHKLFQSAFSFLSATVLGFALLAGEPLSARPVEIEYWHSMTGDKSDRMIELIKEFNARADVKTRLVINPQYVGTYNDGINKLRAATMAGKGPHIAQIFEVGTRIMIDSGVATPLEEFATKDKTFGLEQMLPQVMRYYRVNGTLHSLPFATSNPIVYWNVDWFAKAGLNAAPKTLEEFTSVATKLTDAKAGLTGATWPIHSWFFEQFVARQGAPLLDADNGRSARPTKALYASAEGVRFVSWWANLARSGAWANLGRGWDPAVESFLAGRSAMLITSTSEAFVIPSKAKFKVATAPIPLPTGVDAKLGGTIVGGNALWIMKAKPKPEQELAYEFVRFMASAATQRKWHIGTGYFPIRRDVIAELEKEGFYKKNVAARTAIDQLLASADSPVTHGALMGVFLEARDHVESAIEEVLAGKATVEEALKKAAGRTDKALERYNRTTKSGH